MNLEIAKIVGSLNGSSWSQVHAFRPEDEKLKSHGELAAAISFKAKQEIDISSFGAEIIQRLQEIYYSNQTESILKKLTQTIETLAAEFLDQVELEIVAAAIWNDYLYCAKNASGQVWVKRAEALVKLFSHAGLASVSGKLEPGDTVLAATGQFVELVPEGSLRPALSLETVEAISESLSAPIHGHESNSQAAAIIISTKPPALNSQEGEPLETPPKANRFKPILNNLIARLRQVQKPQIFLGKKINWRRRSTLTIIVVLLLVFIFSLFLAGKKRQNEAKQQALQAVVEEIGYKLGEANNLLTLNPLRAKSLLQESQKRIEEYKVKQKNPGKEILDLEAKVAAALEQVQREYNVEANEWYDFDLVQDGFRGETWDLSETELLVWDGSAKTAALLNLETKAAKIVVAGEDLGQAKTVGLTGKRGFLVNNDKALVVDTAKEKIVATVAADGWQKISRSRGFGSNLYLLDSANNSQIWKYLGMEEGLSSKRSYLEGESYDLSEAVDMAIDGSVWVLFSDGTVAKYTQGRKDAFEIVGLDQPLVSAAKIFTSPEGDHVYVLDHSNTRVVVLDKSGEYVAQYAWSGIAGAKDFVVSEALGKIFFLTGEKVFTVDLK